MNEWKSIEEERYRVVDVNHPSFSSTQYWVFDRKFYGAVYFSNNQRQAEWYAIKLNQGSFSPNLKHCETCRCGRATMDPLTHGV